MKRGILDFAILLTVYVLGAFAGRVTMKAEAAVPPPAPIAVVDDSWVVRRLQACDTICGPVPMEIHATVDSLKCVCGRPMPLRPLKVLPKPLNGG